MSRFANQPCDTCCTVADGEGRCYCDIVSGTVNTSAMVLQKVAFTCERTGRRWSFNSMTDFIVAFLNATQPNNELADAARNLIENAVRSEREYNGYVVHHMLIDVLSRTLDSLGAQGADYATKSTD